LTLEQTVDASDVEHREPPKSALIVGGGVAGMQAALDIANQGFKVHLVEKTPSIGGKMAMIDKTFPTLDCSACILTPRLSEVSRHPNIELLTYSELKRVTGTEGDFRVEVVRNPRYVLEDKCSGCGECVDVCPVEVPNEFDQNLGFRKAIYTPFPQATPNVYTIDKRDHAACVSNCPAGVNAQAFLALTMRERFDEALAIVRDAIPFPGVLGRICVSFCETECARGEYDESLHIRNIHRFLADYERETGNYAPVEVKIDKMEKVAVVGAGPAGISAAYHLARKGYPVTVFEKRSEEGGLMRWAIPEYRLPRDVLKEEIDRVKQMGVDIKTHTMVFSLDYLKDQGYKAFFLATGASKSNKLNISGEDTDGVFYAIDFLDEVNSGDKIDIGERVAVIGGGDAAIDSARVARRLGAKEVTLVYRRSQVEIPAIPGEVEDARREGIRMMMLTSPTKVLSHEGRISGIRCIRMRLGEPDRSGRRRPIPIQDSEFTLTVDSMIVAIGQSVEPIPVHKPLDVDEWGTIVVNPVTYETSEPGVFAGGDVVTGPSTVARVCAHGREAAISIDRYLRGKDMRSGREKSRIRIAKPEIDESTFKPSPRAEMPKQPISKRKSNFSEVELGFDKSTTVDESGRCLGCSICCECKQCVEACERDAIDHDAQEEVVELNPGAIIVATGYQMYDVSQYPRYGYGKYSNVINAMEYERLINAAGPTQGHLIRLSDGKIPKSIGFIQCVGARDTQKGVPNCSRVCCMYGIKNAVMAKEHYPDTDVTIYYADIRAFGKDFEQFYWRAEHRFGVNFVRGRVGEVVEDVDTGNLIIDVEDTEKSKVYTTEHDLIVLSPGLLPSMGLDELSEELGLDLSEDGYVETADSLVTPVDASIPGIFVCGCANGPKDIPDSVSAGSAAAMRASIILGGEKPEEA